MTTAHILVVDDEPDIRELVGEILVDEGYEVSVAENAEQARRARRLRRPDLVLLDVWMPDVDGISLLREWFTEQGQPVPVIMISGHGTVETAVEATRLGAYDFIEKPLSMAKLILTVRHTLEVFRLQQENRGLRRWQPLTEPIGSSAVMQALRTQVQRVAQHNAWVLLHGEAGSGLELFAQYIHQSSSRREGPFVEVRVASIAGANSAVELFGTEDGEHLYFGLLEQANGGTLFLDEVGDMEPAVQARLFSALENRTFLRVGGKEAVRFDVRVVAATHRDLEQAVATGHFREDLYYQLNVVPLHIPPLREHAEDVPELLDYYLAQFAAQENLPQRRFSQEAQNRLRNHDWAGNVRELKNLVQRLLILGHAEEITVSDVNQALGMRQPGKTSAAFDLPLRQARTQFEREYFEQLLQASADNMGQMAHKAGIERTHLYRKLRALGLRK